jgi:hypothetical protein
VTSPVRHWAELIERHESVIRTVTEPHGGSVVKMLGDGSMLGFGSARSAIAASLGLQDALIAEPYAARIGIHAGDVIHSGGDFLGATVNKAARVAAAADGGEIRVPSTVRDLVGAFDGVRFGDPVSLTFKGLAGTHQVMTVSRSWLSDNDHRLVASFARCLAEQGVRELVIHIIETGEDVLALGAREIEANQDRSRNGIPAFVQSRWNLGHGVRSRCSVS